MPEILHVDLVTLDQALERHFAIDVQQAQIVELKYLRGLSVGETEEALGFSSCTVKRNRTVATWLRQQIGEA
jgi:DNA-directed RNA polymerase specialized sigma24 family protein